MRRILFSILLLLNGISLFAQSPAQRMLVVTPDAFVTQLDTFVQFKERQGMQLELMPLSQAGETAAEVKSAIKRVYEENPFFYLLLIGDDNLFPVIHVGGYPADNDYGMMDDDAIPDVAVGKLSVESSTDLMLQLTKIMKAESGEMVYSRSYCNIAGTQSYEGMTDVAFLRDMDSLWTQMGMNTHYELFDGSQGGFDAPGNPTASDLVSIVNRGVDVINYAGHGTAQTFSTTQFTVAHAMQFTNTKSWPVLFSLACETGNYEGATSLAESWMRASYQSEPIGFVAVVAAAAPIPWNAPKTAFRAMIESMAINSDITLGAAWLEGLKALTATDSCEAMLHSWLIFGDPSMKLKNSITNSLSAVNQSGISIYPNPANDYIYITLPNDLSRDFQLFNAAGQLVHYYHLNSSTRISLESLPGGIYFLRGERLFQKLVICH